MPYYLNQNMDDVLSITSSIYKAKNILIKMILRQQNQYLKILLKFPKTLGFFNELKILINSQNIQPNDEIKIISIQESFRRPTPLLHSFLINISFGTDILNNK